MFWMIWVLSIVGVIGVQVYSTRTVIRTRYKYEALQKLVAKARADEKSVRNNLELAQRMLSERFRLIEMQVQAIEKLKQTIQSVEEGRKKKVEEAKKKLMH
jgi:DNA-binding PadR family transcriptional regulator